jgi:hypothetical protein
LLAKHALNESLPSFDSLVWGRAGSHLRQHERLVEVAVLLTHLSEDRLELGIFLLLGGARLLSSYPTCHSFERLLLLSDLLLLRLELLNKLRWKALERVVPLTLRCTRLPLLLPPPVLSCFLLEESVQLLRVRVQQIVQRQSVLDLYWIDLLIYELSIRVVGRV